MFHDVSMSSSTAPSAARPHDGDEQEGDEEESDEEEGDEEENEDQTAVDDQHPAETIKAKPEPAAKPAEKNAVKHVTLEEARKQVQAVARNWLSEQLAQKPQ